MCLQFYIWLINFKVKFSFACFYKVFGLFYDVGVLNCLSYNQQCLRFGEKNIQGCIQIVWYETLCQTGGGEADGYCSELIAYIGE